MQKQTTSNRTDIYQEKDEISHVLDRPDMYVGSLRKKKSVKYVATETESGFRISPKEIEISEAFAKIFMEVLSNAADNVPRSIKNKTPCTKIKVDFDLKTGETSIWNDGRCIPIDKKKGDGRYIHTMIFGHFRTGENYNDDEDREGVGRNGEGSKLSNVFSTKFTVEGVDPQAGKKFSQTWTDNMRKPFSPIVTSCKSKTGYTCVTWIPDFKRFGMKGYTDEVLSLLYKYVIDVAMTTKVPVFLNGEQIPVDNLLDYAEMYIEEETQEMIHLQTKTHEVVLLPNYEGEHRVISFVNGAYTPNDGIHVDAWSEAIFRPLVDKINKKNSTTKQGKVVATRPQVNIKDVKQFFYLFVSVTIPNPEFESQSKTKLEGPEVSASFPVTKINEVYKWQTTDMIDDIINTRELAQLKKSTTKKRGYVKVDKLTSANFEGTKHSHECILIICEGDSAKTYATTGIDIGVYGKKGRDYFGIYPLRGKILNVRKAKVKQITENKVITDLINALGLRYGVDYTIEKEFRTLRYGMLMTLTDADCFSNDTPILTRKNGIIDIVTMERLHDDLDLTNLEIWTGNGWSFIKAINRKPVTKRMIKINTHCGVVTCSEDHKMLLEDGTEKLAKHISIGDNLLRTRRVNNIPLYDRDMNINQLKSITKDLCVFQGSKRTNKKDLLNSIESEIKYCTQYNHVVSMNELSIDEAYVWGLFFADGTCGVYTEKSIPKKETLIRTNITFSISNCDKSLLEKSREILEHLYPDFEWSIIEVTVNEHCSRSYRLLLNRGNKVQSFIETMRDKFYDKTTGYKKVPISILNASHNVQQAFLEGYYAGDGFRWLKTNKNALGFDIQGQIGAQGMCFILERLGYCVNIRCKKSKHEVYTVHYSNKHRRFYPGKVHSIIEHKYDHNYIYDVETDSHTVNAGVGGIVAHNCDGLHILGLALNCIHTLFPTLFQRENPFVVHMSTPIAKIPSLKTKGVFFDEREYNEFMSANNHKHKAKYYKGLGTSSRTEVKETFGQKMIEFIPDDEMDMDMIKVFHNEKGLSDKRKNWLSEYDPMGYKKFDNGPGISQMAISDFLNHYMIQFSLADCERNIPNLMDGLKQSQRKVLYGCLKRKLKSDVKVASLAGYITEHTKYHHGEVSLQDTIKGMASCYTGGNNLPLLARSGEMGSRLQGGKDSASARYVETHLEEITRLIIPECDDCLLKRIIDDGVIVEPEFYVPCIPMVLVNPCKAAIGTGWSSTIPGFNPLDLIKCIKIWLDNDGCAGDSEGNSLFPELVPWYRGFNGVIEQIGNNKFMTHGILERIDDNTVAVKELPIGMWTEDFESMLQDLKGEKDPKKMKIKSFRINYTVSEVYFEIDEAEGFICDENTLKLSKPVSTSNMVLFNEEHRLQKFDSPDEIIDQYCRVKYEYMVKRKARLLKDWETDLTLNENRKRFITEILNKDLTIFQREEEDVIVDMEERGYYKYYKQKNNNDDKDDDKDDGKNDGKREKGYDYLLEMEMRTFTKKRIEKIEKDILRLKKMIADTKKTSEKQLWLNDLDAFEKEYAKMVVRLEKELDQPVPKKKTKGKSKK